MRTMESWLEIAENAIKAAINAKELDNLKQNEMKRDEIVEKIKKIKGVGTVAYNDEQAVVQFEKEIELVEGEIYFVEYKDSDNRVVRYLGMDGTRCVFFYSQYSKQLGLLLGSDYSGSLSLYSNELIPATKKQKKKLIKAEVKNGFFYELEKK